MEAPPAALCWGDVVRLRGCAGGRLCGVVRRADTSGAAAHVALPGGAAAAVRSEHCEVLTPAPRRRPYGPLPGDCVQLSAVLQTAAGETAWPGDLGVVLEASELPEGAEGDLVLRISLPPRLGRSKDELRCFSSECQPVVMPHVGDTVALAEPLPAGCLALHGGAAGAPPRGSVGEVRAWWHEPGRAAPGAAAAAHRYAVRFGGELYGTCP
eukprot:TRINITY_DN9846_c0_g1_i4.p1 TRINITY_DN9846_c0_g1~~TRINITY_DN9846_c0_g1_i4.p1  ORF type:complete len:236 (+),score=34.78 TRINITY_DN9846_c0_g1_i4:78-710(+)